MFRDHDVYILSCNVRHLHFPVELISVNVRPG